MTSEEFNAKTAKFTSLHDAQAAANAAMPRRKHNRPSAHGSGYDSARAGHDIWHVSVGNAYLMNDGTMYDFVREATIRA